MGQLAKEVRKTANLCLAWNHVRSRARSSSVREVVANANRIDENPIREIRRIREALATCTFQFKPMHGHLKKKASSGYRGIMVPDLADRIVQRAILNVLQSDVPKIQRQLGEICSVLRTPTSVGGVRNRSVSDGISLVCRSIHEGAKFYLKSDVKDFFLQVPKKRLFEFVRENTHDDAFCQLFEGALNAELANPEELKDWGHLFPQDDKGVPQGGSLSAFAANVVLHEFDTMLNSAGVQTIRYLDDFVMLAPKPQLLHRAVSQARSILTELEMDIYQPNDGSGKAALGHVNQGFDFLGCRINGENVAPSRKSRLKLLKQIREVIRDSKREIEQFALTAERRHAEATYLQSLTLIDRKIRGWGDAFAFSTNTSLRYRRLILGIPKSANT